MKKFYPAFSIQFIVLFFVLMVPITAAQTFVVTETDDPVPDGCNSGTDCSLREAIIAANDVGSGTATIQLVGGQNYTLSRVNSDTSTDFDPGTADEESGSLKILNNDAVIRIEATGSGMTTIDADEIDRVFFIYPGTSVEMERLVITGGRPQVRHGGGLLVLKNDNLEITNSTITDNTAGDGIGYGGGIRGEGAIIHITESTISNNQAGFKGGGIQLGDYEDSSGETFSSVTIENSLFTGNLVENYGGAIDASSGTTLEISESTIENNRSYYHGGGIYSTHSNTTIKNSAVINNMAKNNDSDSGSGGGIGVYGSGTSPGTLTIINTTISGNVAGNSGSGGGIDSGNKFIEATTNIINSTITDNSAWNGGGINLWGGIMNISNTIVANQSLGDDCSITSGGEPVIHEYNSLGGNLESEDTCGFTLQNLDPFLGPLQDNGGPVFTHALSTDPLSPAINNGNNSLYTDAGGDLANDSDANGNDRVYDIGSGGIIDIGAYEVQQSVGIVGCPVTHEDNILFVKKGENGSGANWFDALGELQDALALFEDETCTADEVEEIWVSAGSYLPTDDTSDREATFNMYSGLYIYGGFLGDGSETNKNQRDIKSNVTILSGDINKDDNLIGNSYHVVMATQDGFAAILDGFTITGGNANDTTPNDKGGGLYASNGSLILNNINFDSNYAETAGGGAYVVEDGTRSTSRHPSFFIVSFMNNEAGGEDANGGGLALKNAKSRISAVTFENNSATYGGGLFNDESDPIIKNTIFRENSAQQEGGGLLNERSSPELYNVLIADNEARVNGGGLVNAINAEPLLTNVTISGNLAELVNGGGIYNRNEAAPTLLNTIIWGNTAGGTGNEIWNSSNSSIELDYSLYGSSDEDIVEGNGFTALNSWTTNPLFEDAPGGDLTLSNSSPAINTGDPSTDLSDFRVITSDAIDLAENPRIYNGDVDIIDMGAYEFQGEPVPPSSCPATDNILYVKKDATGTGASWENALGELRDVYALFDSEDCTTDDVDEVWVAAGTYMPTNTSDRTVSFAIINDVDFYGGFEGVNSETSTEDRDWETNVTILSGDIDEGSDLDGNSYHVVTVIENSTETILDGFNITGGNADFVDTNDNSVGGGLYVNNGLLTVRNVLFDNNYAEISGGGVLIRESGEQPVFINVQFTNNESGLGGGLASYESSPRITQSEFTANMADWGGGAHLFAGSPLIDQTTFTGNIGNTSGGGVSINAGTAAKSVPSASADPGDMVLITNSVISGNESKGETGGGGGIINQGSYLVLRNVLISGNLSDGYGGGIEFADTESALIINSTITGNQSQNFGGGVQIINSSPTVQNSIVWNNDSIDRDFARADNFNIGTGEPEISYSLIQGCKPGGTWDVACGTDGDNNLSDSDPFFDTGISPGDSPTTGGNFTLTSASPVINIGDNTLYTDSGGDINNDLDLAGEDRLFDGTTDVIDLGAYEFQGEPDGEEPEFRPFITTWKTDNDGDSNDDQITIQTEGSGYDYDVYWESIPFTSGSGSNGSEKGNTGDLTITFPSAGTYRVEITGDYPRIYINNEGDKEKILTIEQWGDIAWSSFGNAFGGASNLTYNATDTPDLSVVTDMSGMFYSASSFNGNLINWDVSNVTDMSSLFSEASSFNGDLSGWNVGSVTDMSFMFNEASSFNEDLSEWDVSVVTNMRNMFAGAASFNGDLSNWDVSSVDNMRRMFVSASSFNGDLSSWDVSSVESMFAMFGEASSFNSDLSGWDVSSVQSMRFMFSGASSFNQNLGNWDISSIEVSNANVGMNSMLDGSGLSTENYDNTLIGWEDGTVMNDVELGADDLTYCNGEAARQALIDDHNWTFNDDALADGCTSPEGDDQRILVSNDGDYIFSKSDFGISNDDYSIHIESLPDEGTLELDGNAVSEDDRITMEDFNNNEFTWDLPDRAYGYNFTSFEFRIADESGNQSENPYTVTIDLGTAIIELSGSEGWRLMTNPSEGDSYFDLFSDITVETNAPYYQTLYELNQEDYEWDPVESTGDEPGVGTPFILYVLEGDLPEITKSGDNWTDLDGSYSFSGLDYDSEENEPNPDDFYLLGNPHPIALDFCGFDDGDKISTAAYFWNPEGNGGNGDYVSLNCAGSDEVYIAPFQAFWVRTTGANPVLEIPMEAYLEGTTDGYFKEAERSAKSSPDFADLGEGNEPSDGYVVTLNVTGEDGLFTNRTQILFSGDATEGLDRFDAPKLSAEGLASQWLSFHSMDENGRTYAFQSLPESLLSGENIRIPLDIQTTESGRFTLDWTLPEANLFNGSYFLRDTQSSEVIELREGAGYSFEISPDQSFKDSESLEVSGEKRSAKFPKNFADLAKNPVPRFELLITTDGIDGLPEPGGVPDAFELAQNYPNPFNPTTVISYQLPVSSEVLLEVYDMLGRNVATLVNGQVSAGRHTVNFDAENLSSGIYLYRLQAGTQIMTRKLTVLK